MPAARRPEVLRGRVFRKGDVVARGLLTPSELRSRAWRRLYRGVYADAELPDSLSLRVSGASLLLPDTAAFTGRTAAVLHGAAALGDLRSPLDVSVPTGVRLGPIAGLRIHQVGLEQSDVLVVDRRRCTTALRTALDIARREPLADAVAALDVLLARVIVGRGELAEAAGQCEGRGSRRVRQAVDLALPEQRIAIEYDGAWHAERGRFAKDRRRLNGLVVAGWRVIHVTAADLRDPEGLVARVRAFVSTATSAK